MTLAERISRVRKSLRQRRHQRLEQWRKYRRTRKVGHKREVKRDKKRITSLKAVLRKLLRRESHLPTVMYDSVTVSTIPKNAPAVAGYIGGRWPTYRELRAQFPKAHKVSVAVAANYDADCLDIEIGDASPHDAPAWVRRQKDRGVRRPIVYASASVMNEVLAILKAAGIQRHEVRVWTAHYGSGEHLCGPSTCRFLNSTTADATQWTDTAHGRNLDQSVLVHSFFA